MLTLGSALIWIMSGPGLLSFNPEVVLTLNREDAVAGGDSCNCKSFLTLTAKRRYLRRLRLRFLKRRKRDADSRLDLDPKPDDLF